MNRARCPDVVSSVPTVADYDGDFTLIGIEVGYFDALRSE